jgi:hypothetical protein
MSTTTSVPPSTALPPAPAGTAPGAPRAVTPRRSRHAVRPRSAGTARIAAVALVTLLALTIPAVPLLDTPGAAVSSLDIAVSFVLVAALQVVVARGIYLLARQRAHPAAYAALLSRVGHAMLLAVAAGLLAVKGVDGVDGFRADWRTALLVLAVHLVVAAVALWRARLAPRAVPVAVAVGGAASLVLAAVTPGQEAILPVLAPLLVADALLAGALLRSAALSR